MPSPHSIHDYLRMAQTHRQLATDYRPLIRIVRHRFRHARKSKSFFFSFFFFSPQDRHTAKPYSRLRHTFTNPRPFQPHFLTTDTLRITPRPTKTSKPFAT